MPALVSGNRESMRASYPAWFRWLYGFVAAAAVAAVLVLWGGLVFAWLGLPEATGESASLPSLEMAYVIDRLISFAFSFLFLALLVLAPVLTYVALYSLLSTSLSWVELRDDGLVLGTWAGPRFIPWNEVEAWTRDVVLLRTFLLNVFMLLPFSASVIHLRSRKHAPAKAFVIYSPMQGYSELQERLASRVWLHPGRLRL